MKTLLVSMSRADTVYGTHPVRYAVLRGRDVLRQGQGPVDELHSVGASSIRLSLDSPANLTERVRLRALARRFVPVLVQRHLADSGVFTERFRFRGQVVWLRQGEAEVDVMAMLEDDAELAQELLPAQDRPLTHLVSAEAAVAALVGAATPAPVLVHWWHAGGLRTLGVRSGRVIWQRVQPAIHGKSDTPPEGWRTLLDAAASTAPLEFSGSHLQVLRLGTGPWAASGEWATNGSRELVQRVASLVRGLPSGELLAQPELYGLLFARRQQSLIVNGYRQRVTAWHWAPPVAALASLVGAVSLGAGIWWHALAGRDQASLQLDATTLAAQAQSLQQMRPPTEAVNALRSAAWRETALGANLRTDHFLRELLAQMPPGVQVQRLSMQRNDVANARLQLQNGQPVQTASARRTVRKRTDTQTASASSSSAAELSEVTLSFTQAAPHRRMPAAGEPSFQVELDIAVSGGYAGAKLTAEQLAERLTRLGRLSDTRLTFQDRGQLAPGARLQTRLTIAAGAF
jgi:hypothetical protein